MITCFIRYGIDPARRADFVENAQNWGRVIPKFGADPIGCFAPHEGSSTLAYGVYNFASLAEYEVYRARLAPDLPGKENYEFARSEGFILYETRAFLRLASAPHAEFVVP